jgi:DNA-binding HxlR family transcriptional regulator
MGTTQTKKRGGQEYGEEEICASLFKLFGDRWSLRIVNVLRSGALRFGALTHQLGINSATLTARLKTLERVGVLVRREDTIDKLSVTYELTASGRELLPIYDGILRFGKNLKAK